MSPLREVIVALDCVEIDELAPVETIRKAQNLVDRVSAMLTKLILSAERERSPR